MNCKPPSYFLLQSYSWFLLLFLQSYIWFLLPFYSHTLLQSYPSTGILIYWHTFVKLRNQTTCSFYGINFSPTQSGISRLIKIAILDAVRQQVAKTPCHKLVARDLAVLYTTVRQDLITITIMLCACLWPCSCCWMRQ